MRSRSVVAIAVLAMVVVALGAGRESRPTEAAVDEIVGVVLDATSIPVPDAFVTLTRNGFFEASTRSGVAGSFRFAGIATGSYVVHVGVDRPDLLPTSVPVTVTAGQTSTVTVGMEPAAIVEVVVTPSDVARTTTVSLLHDGEVLALARSAVPVDGTAVFTQVRPGRYRVLTTSLDPRYAGEWYPDSPTQSGAAVLDLVPGSRAVALDLDEATWITGRVFLPDRTPDLAAAARVRIESVGAPDGDVPISCNEPAAGGLAGAYQIGCLHPAGTYLVSVPGDEDGTAEYYIGAHRAQDAMPVAVARPRLGIDLYLGENDPALVAMTPSRRVDTRLLGERPAAGSVVTVPMLPPLAAAVMANLTVDSPQGPGFVTAYPCSAERPLASHVNYVRGETASNAIVIPTDLSGQLCVYTHASAHIVVDVTAWIPPGATPATVVPARILDTRPGMSTTDGLAQGIGRREAGSTLEVQVAGRGNIPQGARAAILNVTAVGAAEAGYVTVHPCDADPPIASNLNMIAGQTIANAVLTKLDPAGRACVSTSAPVDVVIDTAAFVPADGIPTAVVPARLADTRPGFTTTDGTSQALGRVGAGQTIEIQVAGRGGVSSDAVAALLNVTAVGPDRAGFLTVFPCDETSVPNASNVNYTAGEVVSNAATTRLDGRGRVCVYSWAPTDVVVDVNGFVPVRAPATLG